MTRSGTAKMALLTVLSLAPILAACGGARRPAVPPSAPARAAADPDLESRALLLLLEDRRMYESGVLESMLGGSIEVRRALAVALGRIGDARGRSLLQGLLIDNDVEVRRAAAFALGQLGVPEAVGALRVAAVDDDPEVGALAVEALGKLGAPLAEVRRVLAALAPEVAWRRLAPFLFRFKEPATVEAARQALASQDVVVRRGAAYALGREARPESLPALRELLGDSDPFVRALAARGVGQVGGIEDLARLLPLLDDPAVSPRVQAMRAGTAILGRVQALPPLGWGEKLAISFADPRPGIRAAALEAAARFLPNPKLEQALRASWAKGETRERELALAALVAGRVADAGQLVAVAAESPERTLRAQAATACGGLGDHELALRLVGDREPLVRVAALGALKTLGETSALFSALDDRDPTVRATALEALADSPELPTARVAAMIDAARTDGAQNDVRRTGIEVLAARAKAHPQRDRAPVVTALQELASDSDWLVRRAAADALAGLGEPRPAIGPVETGRNLEIYRQILAETATPRYVALETTRGRLVVELACPEAPLTCLSFLQLARQHFFDGTLWHRVVPDFVVQGGDPRGDGWGGPGYSLRDENNPLRYDRGALGMALSGPDTGGSQFFLTLSPQPHLDGGYTVFGHLVEGDGVLDQIRQGDRLNRAVEVPAPAGAAVR